MILGGRSSENAISIASATSVIEALEASGDRVVPVQIDREGRWAMLEAGRASDGSAELVRLPSKEVATKGISGARAGL